MGGSKKSKRVSWASDVNLCQVMLFLSEESPSQVGMGTQDHLQAKALWLAHPVGMGSDDNLPPGFEGIQPPNFWTIKLSQIPLIKWKCPPKFEVNTMWRVVAGEESRETEAQNEREMGVFEAIYPRPSAIPPNPSALISMEDSIDDDQNTPVVPITPIEDDDAALDYGPFSSQVDATGNLHANAVTTSDVEPDIVAAAQAALTSVMSNNNQGSLINHELLIKILSNVEMVKQLVTNHGASSGKQSVQSSSLHSMPSSSLHSMPSSSLHSMPSSSLHSMPTPSIHTVAVPSVHSAPSPSMHNTPSPIMHNVPPPGMHNVPPSGMHNMPSTSSQFMPNLISPPKTSFDPANNAINRRDSLSSHMSRPESIASPRAAGNAPSYNPSGIGSISYLRPSVPDVVSAPHPSMGTPVVKDINYYKSLIQQHGGEKRGTLPQFAHLNNQQLGANHEPLKPKIMKPCIFFNTSRGCRNGTNCNYQHDISTQQTVGGIPEVPNAKRVKMDREITGL